ncbi:peptidoglycan DD-metalloendopeptidase family protein [Phormidium sp. CLA17]|uniref:peptidoglycan DD-metalloendopeptidase family protein n=1 Tax=Leptolyngbya sp. Cla-17 TaxID=2803751 RepID=UPI001A3C697C|nr:peptidoglycan DD-metalloendopeptidase family protein [Leptolyngbya sp. Cla-17]MBM0741971.1 peptidoglycan DD-metalloendopeptidase family protein [Leptolyngbya sp. Cla-17]
MRRTFPQKVKPVPSCMNEHEETTAQAKQADPEPNRRARTSAAMIGLAISMGAYSLPISSQGDGAVAAEPIQNEPVTSASSASFEAATLSPNSEVVESSISRSDRKVSHTVQEGQTLWDVARFYTTDANSVASANGLSVNAVLRVGQVLIIPTDTRLAQALDASASPNSPSYYGPISNQIQESEPQADSADSDDLKNKQHKALENLKQKTQSLQSGLAVLSSKKYKAVPQSAQQVPQTEQQVQVVSTLPVERESDKALTPQPLVSSDTRQQVAFRAPVNTQLPTSPAQTNRASSYQIVPGDTLVAIARIHSISVKQLAEANRISDPNQIFVNQTLIIPPSQSAAGERSDYKGLIASIPVTSTVATASYTSLPSSTATFAPSPSASVQVAIASLSGKSQVQTTSESESRLVRYNHVENLRQEIDQLRQRYQTQTPRPQAAPQLETKVAAYPVATGGGYAAGLSDRVNSEFSGDRSATLRTQLQEMRSRVRVDSSNEVKASSQQPMRVQNQRQVVAVAPVGSESYDPLLQSKIGQAVSPELPSLGTSESYLPGSGERSEGFVWPTKGVLTSGFGWRWGRMHKGVDIAGPTGTPVVAAAEGTVVTAGWNSGGYGYLVEIQHPDGSLTLYAHNSRVLVQVGQQVAQGQQVSEMGSTGYSTGPHLHFEIHSSGKGAVNPMAYLPRS